MAAGWLAKRSNTRNMYNTAKDVRKGLSKKFLKTKYFKTNTCIQFCLKLKQKTERKERIQKEGTRVVIFKEKIQQRTMVQQRKDNLNIDENICEILIVKNNETNKKNEKRITCS